MEYEVSSNHLAYTGTWVKQTSQVKSLHLVIGI